MSAWFTVYPELGGRILRPSFYAPAPLGAALGFEVAVESIYEYEFIVEDAFPPFSREDAFHV